jgi:hypothetical protein
MLTATGGGVSLGIVPRTEKGPTESARRAKGEAVLVAFGHVECAGSRGGGSDDVRGRGIGWREFESLETSVGKLRV